MAKNPDTQDLDKEVSTAAGPENPVTPDTVQGIYDHRSAQWIVDMGLTDLKVEGDTVSAVLPQHPSLHLQHGAICGQAILAAIDSVVALAVETRAKRSKGTTNQNTRFLRPAIGEDLRIVATVLHFGSKIIYAETYVRFVHSNKLVAHATSEFVY